MSDGKHIACLDGIRGSLAIWVVVGHTCNAVGLKVPVLDAPGSAVDLFMVLSGFLMMYHWKDTGSGFFKSATTFWIRRFFRLAPLYYLLLAVALWAGPELREWGTQTQAAISHSQPSEAPAPPPTISDRSVSIVSVVAHVSFVYGLFPKLCSNNPLPDWSLSLEMQFYLVFPLLVMAMTSRRLPYCIIGGMIVAYLMSKSFGLYDQVGPLGNYPQPSFLPFKIHVFLVGMCLGKMLKLRADNLGDRDLYWIFYFLPLMLVVKVVALLCSAFIGVVCIKSWLFGVADRLMSTRLFRFFGDISYGMYLSHVFVLTIVLKLLVETQFFLHLGLLPRFLVTVALVLPLTMLISFCLHHAVELPGISFGRKFTPKRVAAGPVEPQTVLDTGNKA